MDGTRDKPTGKNAENWSRRDGIRAGAVSGPWRSAPRSEAPERRPPAPVTPAAAATARRARTDVAPAPEPIFETEPPRERTRRRRTLAVPLRIWFGLGAIGALLVAGLLALVLSGGEEAAPTAAVPAADPAAVAAVPGAADAAALGSISSLRLRVPETLEVARRDELAAALGGLGIDDVRVEALPFEVTGSRVGYYSADDVDRAAALAAAAAPLVGAPAPLPVRDYSKLIEEEAEPGRLDLWVAD